ncbi:hypothetical protein DSL72_006728 [Monilinia vaccinii-corymbosi]|uniref:Uncharacterized protein n=1 Tax=Monilinia vaccinii-corymbosi TaxID=61207 RepID=A0A8A3PPM5_9HELO|nr:hypothetical protein DSL72_006728 [Monilinia vaccinii-corymbosi]
MNNYYAHGYPIRQGPRPRDHLIRSDIRDYDAFPHNRLSPLVYHDGNAQAIGGAMGGRGRMNSGRPMEPDARMYAETLALYLGKSRETPLSSSKSILLVPSPSVNGVDNDMDR